MSWNSFHRRADVLRAVIATADQRVDGILPMDVEGVAETFADELALLGALQLRWHTRLAGRIERELLDQPMDLEAAVVNAWRDTADELAGIRAIVDHYRTEPLDAAMASAMAKASLQDHALLAAMSGTSSTQNGAADRAGAAIESKARATPLCPVQAARPEIPGLLDRIKAALAA